MPKADSQTAASKIAEMHLEMASAIAELEYPQARALLPPWVSQCEIDLACNWLESRNVPVPPLYARLRIKSLPPNLPVARLLFHAVAPMIAQQFDHEWDIVSVIYFMLTNRATWRALAHDQEAWRRRIVRIDRRYETFSPQERCHRVLACRLFNQRCVSCLAIPLRSSICSQDGEHAWPPRPRWAMVCSKCREPWSRRVYQIHSIDCDFWHELPDVYRHTISGSFSYRARLQMLVKFGQSKLCMYTPALLALWMSAHQWRVLKLNNLIQAVTQRTDMAEHHFAFEYLVYVLTRLTQTQHTLPSEPAFYRNALRLLDEVKVDDRAGMDRLVSEINEMSSRRWLR